MNPRNLTREAIEQLNDIEPHCFETDREEQWFNIGLQYGLDVADSDPISPWISVEDDLPCNHEELMEDKHRTKSVLVVLAWDNDPSKKHIEVCSMCDMFSSFNIGWHWCNSGFYHVVYWKPLPKMPD